MHVQITPFELNLCNAVPPIWKVLLLASFYWPGRGRKRKVLPRDGTSSGRLNAGLGETGKEEMYMYVLTNPLRKSHDARKRKKTDEKFCAR
jgi:hypothetical protein